MAKYTNIQHSDNCGIEIQIRLNPKIILLKITLSLIKILSVKSSNYVAIISYALEIINTGIYQNLGKPQK